MSESLKNSASHTAMLASGDDADGDDGFNNSFASGQLIRGTLLGWNDAKHWTQDGLPAPSPLLVVGVTTALQMWKGGKPSVLLDRPLPDPADLNSSIPVSEWEKGIDGKPRPPWQDVIAVYCIDPAKGGFYTYVSGTTGAHIAFDRLRDAVESMRMLRGDKVLPLIELGERPMKTKFGIKSRPHFEVVAWKEPTGMALREAPPTAALPLEALPPASEPEAQPAPPAKTTAQPAPPVKTTRRGLKDVAPASPSEVINDEIPY